MSYIDSPAFDNDWDSLMNDISSTGVSVLLYGIYINLFLLALYTLSRRRQSSGVKLLIAATCVMAILATAQVAVGVAESALHARALQRAIRLQSSPAKPSHVYNILSVLGNFLFVLNNFVTDSFSFLYRCYVIWGHHTKIIILPVLFMTSTLVAGILAIMPESHVDIRIVYGLCAATNLLLTTFIAGRILWVRRLSSHVGLDNTLRSRYNVVLKLILESGAIYSVTAILLIITPTLEPWVYNFVVCIAQQLLNIIPTFTLVYIGLTNTAENPLPAHRLMHQGTPGKPPPLHPRPVQSFTLSCPLDIQQGDTEGEDAEERMNIT
ncbi:hypothetical protein B0H14DRAFT_2906542 [Mycena olivaceomarginata]|nr:hypothetical protein B0H14DRAFT_2906542 [Mycena olivaceomarginata]